MTEASKARKHYDAKSEPTTEDRVRLIRARRRPWCVVGGLPVVTLPEGMTVAHYETVRGILPKWTPAGAKVSIVPARVRVVAGVGNRRRRSRARRAARRAAERERAVALRANETSAIHANRIRAATGHPIVPRPVDRRGPTSPNSRERRRMRRAARAAAPAAHTLSSPLSPAEAMREAGQATAEQIRRGVTLARMLCGRG